MLFVDDITRDQFAPMMIGISIMLAIFSYLDYRRGRRDSSIMNAYASATALSDPFIAGGLAWIAMYMYLTRTNHLNSYISALLPSTVPGSCYITMGVVYA